MHTHTPRGGVRLARASCTNHRPHTHTRSLPKTSALLQSRGRGVVRVPQLLLVVVDHELGVGLVGGRGAPIFQCALGNGHILAAKARLRPLLPELPRQVVGEKDADEPRRRLAPREGEGRDERARAALLRPGLRPRMMQRRHPVLVERVVRELRQEHIDEALIEHENQSGVGCAAIRAERGDAKPSEVRLVASEKLAAHGGGVRVPLGGA
mmetsp:Transcript_41042/g.128627  ORF Transcript_41042/g.128627 Transcript_41042/m.128627 type:complete len:210 (-) Transcript_41042:1574-2203(-)